MSDLFVHQPGGTLIHRLPAGYKLIGMAFAAIVVMVLRGPLPGVIAVGLALLLAMVARVPWRRIGKALIGVAIAGVVIAAFQWWQLGWYEGGLRALETVSEIVALVLLATIVVVTTPAEDTLEAITTALRPLRRFGVPTQQIALAFSLVLRMIPVAIDIAAQTRDAARARGLERSPSARLTPTVIRMVAHAQQTGEALWVRGLADPDDDQISTTGAVGPGDSVGG